MSNLKNQNAIIKNIKSIWSNPKKRTRFLQILLAVILGLSFIISITNDISFIGLLLMVFVSVCGISFVLFILYFFVSNIGMREKKAIELKQEYEDILDRLSRNPNSQKLRQLALEIARDYYSSLRNDGRLTIYDEQAIQNDLSLIINSSNNSYTQQSNDNSIENKDNSDSLAKLEKLKHLKDKGLITEADYEAKKQKILDEL